MLVKRRSIVTLFGQIVMSSLCCLSLGQVADPAWNLSLIGHMGGWSWTVTIVAPYAYVGERADLTILDISNPSSPLPSGHLALGDFYVTDIRVKDGLAYLTGGSYLGQSGLQIIDVANPQEPDIIGFHATPFPATGVYLTNNLAYVTNTFGPAYEAQGGFDVIDVSNPSSPTLVGSSYTPPITAWRIYVTGGIAYVATGDGLRIFDVTNPSVPGSLASYDQHYCWDVYVSEGLAYTATWSGLEVVDVTSPTVPTRRGRLTSGDAYALCFSDDLVFLTLPGEGETDIIDVRDPSSPTLTGSFSTRGWPWDVAVSSDTAYIADGPGGLAIVDVSAPSSPTLRATYDTLSDPWDVCVSGEVAYVANGLRGLKIVDVSNPRSPGILGSLSTEIPATGVTTVGSRVYVWGFWHTYVGPLPPGFLQIVDVSVPSSPVVLGSYYGPHPFDVAVSNGLAYIADAYVGLKIVDVVSPSSPTLIGSFETPSSADAVFVSGNLAYVADYTSLQIVDVQDPTSPVFRSSFPGWDINSVFVSNGVAYVTGTWAGADFKCIDVTNADAPRLLGSYDVSPYTYEAGGLSVSNGFAYVLLDDLRVLDVSDPTRPTLCGFYPAGRATFASDLFACGNLVYLVDTLGLRIFQFTGDDTGAPHWRLYR